ncbi:hypothetical protein K469DRAFT_586460 [Zopfia rhizophila CBS 207.26]|uniref:Uncharacterized protein n=1 Tax=Zopfia rhizophila CBS 207.26 TaxID=1314779 RepID=A0A6A6DXC5_9PEZI|nr:hypothetical protein K469DRAFT_586460 [Zopfia rhizophila CBS 207.26]
MVAKSAVLLPLYIYPEAGKWDTLHSTVAANPTLHFTIIVNPNSGPGYAPWWPNSDYLRELPKLNAAPNVRTVGYVRTGRAQRDIAEVRQDIAAYAGRSSEPGLGVEGVFFDETPNLYSEEVKTYLDQITQDVKDSTGILGDRTVIHNPGTSVNKELANPGPDITTVVEQDYTTYNTKEYQDWLATNPYNRSRSSYMVYATPGDQVQLFTLSIRERAEYLFVTDLVTEFYHSFGPSWSDFIAAMNLP